VPPCGGVALDPGRIPRTYGQVFLLQLPAKPALDAARAQEQVDVPKEWKQKGLLGGRWGWERRVA